MSIKIISSDGVNFIVEERVAEISETIKLFMSSRNEIVLPIKARYLRKCFEFMKKKVTSDPDVFMYYVDEDDVIQMLDVAAYLRI